MADKKQPKKIEVMKKEHLGKQVFIPSLNGHFTIDNNPRMIPLYCEALGGTKKHTRLINNPDYKGE